MEHELCLCNVLGKRPFRGVFPETGNPGFLMRFLSVGVVAYLADNVMLFEASITRPSSVTKGKIMRPSLDRPFDCPDCHIGRWGLAESVAIMTHDGPNGTSRYTRKLNKN